MKRKFILLVALVALFSTTTVSAQYYDARKVAITEVVDKSKDGNLSIGLKTFIRSALTNAINNSEGYQGYDKISFMSLEMNFDRTGNISSATLIYVQKQECQYILISEVTPLTKTLILLSARIVNTSTGEIVESSSKQAPLDNDYVTLDNICKSLAYDLVRAM